MPVKKVAPFVQCSEEPGLLDHTRYEDGIRPDLLNIINNGTPVKSFQK
jgi:hypothetical protein